MSSRMVALRGVGVVVIGAFVAIASTTIWGSLIGSTMIFAGAYIQRHDDVWLPLRQRLNKLLPLDMDELKTLNVGDEAQVRSRRTGRWSGEVTIWELRGSNISITAQGRMLYLTRWKILATSRITEILEPDGDPAQLANLRNESYMAQPAQLVEEIVKRLETLHGIRRPPPTY